MHEIDSDKIGPCRYSVVTLHRPSNVDDPKIFRGIFQALATLSKDMPIIFPAHPRTMRRIQDFHLESCFSGDLSTGKSLVRGPGLYRLDPLGYLDFLCLTSMANLVLTDSGGLQEETTILGIPCVTLRQNTERPITLKQGTNVLAGTDQEQILSHARQQLAQPKKPTRPKFWDGQAGARIVKVLSEWAGASH